MSGPRDFSLTATPGRVLPTAVRGEGCRIWTSDGQEWIDACGGAMVMSVGHCHPRLVEALKRQAEQLTFTYRFSFSNEPMLELAELLREISPLPDTWAQPPSRHAGCRAPWWAAPWDRRAAVEISIAPVTGPHPPGARCNRTRWRLHYARAHIRRLSRYRH